MFNQKKRYLIVEENDVTAVLSAINHNQGFFSNENKLVENCGWADEPTKWFIRFYASKREWSRMTKDLSELGEITVKVAPGGTTDMYFTRKES